MEKLGVSSLQTKGGLGFYRAPHLEATGRLIHAFSTRQGGVSPPPFESLNLGFDTGDKAIHIRKNREILTDAFGLSPSVLLTVNQVHEDGILVVDSAWPQDYSGASCDAIISDRPGLAIGVLTADCVPVLLFDPDHLTVAVIHAGWKGTSLDLPGNTVATMVDRFNTRPENLMAVVGPSIGPCCYEIDEPVYSVFSRRHDSRSKWTKGVSPSSWMLNLPQGNVDLLVESGVRRENVVLIDICTRCRRDLFYSHRGDRGTTGRQISFIMLK